MLRDTAVAEIQLALGFRSDKAAEIVQALQNAQEYYEAWKELPFFLRTEISSISTTADEERIPLPPDFLREWEDDALYYFNSSAEDADKWVQLHKDDLQTLRANDNLAGSASPQAYAKDALYFRIFPTPDAIYPIKMIYYANDTTLATNVENQWMKWLPYLLMGRAGGVIAGGMGHDKTLARFQQWENDGRTLLAEQSVAIDTENRKLAMGGEA